MRWRYAIALQKEENHTEAVAIYEDVARRSRRVFGDINPMTKSVERGLREARERLSNS